MYYTCICDYTIFGCSFDKKEINICPCDNPCEMANTEINPPYNNIKLKICPSCKNPYENRYHRVRLSPGILSLVEENLKKGVTCIRHKHY